MHDHIHKLTALADSLDQSGLKAEADLIDEVIAVLAVAARKMPTVKRASYSTALGKIAATFERVGLVPQADRVHEIIQSLVENSKVEFLF